MRYITTDSSGLMFEVEEISKYSEHIRIKVNDEIAFEGHIDEEFDFSVEYNNGDEIKLYILINDIWIFLESCIYKYVSYTLNEDKMTQYLEERNNYLKDLVYDTKA